MKTVLKMFFAILMIILIVSFIVQNPRLTSESYTLQYFGYQTAPIQLPIILLGAIFLGALLVLGATLMEYFGLKRIIHRQERKLHQLEQELNSLRNLPLLGEKDESGKIKFDN